MRIYNNKIISSDPRDAGLNLAVPFQAVLVAIASGTLSGSFSTPGIDIAHEYGFSVTVSISGSLTGSVALYASNEPGNTMVPKRFGQQVAGQSMTYLDQGLNNWSLVRDPNNVPALQPLSASTTGGPSLVTFNAAQQFYRWLQVRWVHNAGTGSIDGWITAKGDAD